jgi:hypothetical protein
LIHFTIIIPTRNRADTLGTTLLNVLEQDYPEMEVLVADNSSDQRTQSLVKTVNDVRVRYLKTGPGLSMASNWERALSEVNHGWVTVIGDDDGLLMGALARVNKLVENTKVAAVRSTSADYIWPSDTRHPKGHLSFVLEKETKLVNSKTAINEVLAGELSYNKLPMLYNGGFVDIALIRRAKSYNNQFYHSSIPDVYSAFAFAFLTECYLLVNYPLAINGTSRHSGGTAFFQHDEESQAYEPARLFASEDNMPNHPGVPALDTGFPLRSIHAHVLESYLQAREIFDRELIDIDYARQLRLIMNDARESQNVLSTWGLQFSNLHDIEFETDFVSEHDACEKSPTRKIRDKTVAKILKVTSWPKIIEIDGIKKSLVNLSEAERLTTKIISRYIH